ENGQILVARLGEEVTVKRFERKGDTVRLLPENPDFEPIVIDLRHQPLAIEGIGVGILRRGVSSGAQQSNPCCSMRKSGAARPQPAKPATPSPAVFRNSTHACPAAAGRAAP
ncbi:MAG: S24 family peptidase, partial [Acidihalobacter sp.]